MLFSSSVAIEVLDHLLHKAEDWTVNEEESALDLVHDPGPVMRAARKKEGIDGPFPFGCHS